MSFKKENKQTKWKQKQICGLKKALKQIQKLNHLVTDSENCFIWKSNFTRSHFIQVKNNSGFKLQKSTKRSLLNRQYLLLLPPVLKGGLGVLVETIWQCTVPRSSISHTGPITSVRGMLCGLEAEQNNTIAATTKGKENMFNYRSDSLLLNFKNRLNTASCKIIFLKSNEFKCYSRQALSDYLIGCHWLTTLFSNKFLEQDNTEQSLKYTP